MIEVPFNIVTNNKPNKSFVFHFETPEEAVNFFEERNFKHDPDEPAVMSKPFIDKNGVTGIAFAIIPYITVPEEPSEYEISSLLEPEVIA